MITNIYFRKKFRKQFEKLNEKNKKSVVSAIQRFQENPFDPFLYNHPLKGEFLGFRSISAEFDLRIIFEQEKNYATVVFLQVGTHGQLY
jgi:addiction module RelE/StbE family toxin